MGFSKYRHFQKDDWLYGFPYFRLVNSKISGRSEMVATSISRRSVDVLRSASTGAKCLHDFSLRPFSFFRFPRAAWPRLR